MEQGVLGLCLLYIKWNAAALSNIWILYQNSYSTRWLKGMKRGQWTPYFLFASKLLSLSQNGGILSQLLKEWRHSVVAISFCQNQKVAPSPGLGAKCVLEAPKWLLHSVKAYIAKQDKGLLFPEMGIWWKPLNGNVMFLFLKSLLCLAFLLNHHLCKMNDWIKNALLVLRARSCFHYRDINRYPSEGHLSKWQSVDLPFS